MGGEREKLDGAQDRLWLSVLQCLLCNHPGEKGAPQVRQRSSRAQTRWCVPPISNSDRWHWEKAPFHQGTTLRRTHRNGSSGEEATLTCLGVPEFKVPVVGRTEELCSGSVEADVSHSFAVTNKCSQTAPVSINFP